ncbi:17280_t:CDS:2, partial [Cetraspora pellucida]
IILMNTTYKTNHFGIPLLLISGVDAMKITFLIASGLLVNETILTYSWILHQLKKVVDDNHQLCIWHIEQNIVKNLMSKHSNKFLAFSKDFKLVITKIVEDQFTIHWDHLLKEYPEVNSYIEQWKSISHMWAYCYINKNINYGIRTTQCSEA